MGIRLIPLVRHALGAKRGQGQGQPRGGQGPRRGGRRPPSAGRRDSAAAEVLDVEAPATLQRRFRRAPSHGMHDPSMPPAPPVYTMPWDEAPWDAPRHSLAERLPPTQTIMFGADDRPLGPQPWDAESTEGDSDTAEDPMDKTFLTFYTEKVLEAQRKGGDKDHLPISGNLYMYRAIAGFGDSSGLFQEEAGPLLMVGLVVTMLVQVTGPLILWWWAYSKLRLAPSIIGVSRIVHAQEYSADFASYIMQRILGLMFLILFTVNGLYTLRSDRKETEKMVHMCKVFEKAADKYDQYEPPNERWLWIGAVVNVWCLVVCSICMTLLFLVAESDKGPKDIIFDAFGITFLFNLDDPVGDLSFLDEKWDEDLMGDIYGLLADNLPIMREIEHDREGHCSPDNIYEVGVVLQWIMIFFLPFIFLFGEWTAIPE